MYCGEPDEVVDEYMKHYNGESGTYFSFLPVHHKQSAGYECLLGAIEMGYIGKNLKNTLFEMCNKDICYVLSQWLKWTFIDDSDMIN